MTYTIRTETSKGEVEMKWLSAGDLNPFTSEFHEAATVRVSIAIQNDWCVARVINENGQVVARVERN